jgi:hypothetical protein
MQDQRGDGADQKKRAATDAVDVRQDDACCHQEDDVLDGGGVERGVSGKAGHAEHCYNTSQQIFYRRWFLVSPGDGLP